MAPLLARFDRVSERRDRACVRRSDGSEVAWETPSYGGALPHDAVHLIVESAFGLRWGLWGLVEGGADPGRINAEASRARATGGQYEGFGADVAELLAAEALAAVHWYDPELDPAARLRDLEARAEEFGATLPATVDAERTREVVRVMRALRATFRAAGERGLTLSFWVEAPTRAFEALCASPTTSP